MTTFYDVEECNDICDQSKNKRAFLWLSVYKYHGIDRSKVGLIFHDRIKFQFSVKILNYHHV